jgi:tetratricopeptide (TPR) repeat protein
MIDPTQPTLSRPLPTPPAVKLLITLVIVLMAAGCRRESAETYVAAGDRALQSVRLDEARKNYEAAVRFAPNDPRAHLALGNFYVFAQKTPEAQLEFMKVLELAPRNAAAHAALGGLYAGQSELGLAEEQYQAAVALEPLNSANRLSLASVLQKEGKYSSAEDQIRTVIGLEPKNAHAHLALANLLSAQRNRQNEALAEYAQTRALDPTLLATPTGPAPAATPSPAVASAAPGTSKLKPLDRRFLLTKNSDVYQNPDASSSVVGHVHRRAFVHVIGIKGDWLQIKLRNGTVGFIPVSAAE